MKRREKQASQQENPQETLSDESRSLSDGKSPDTPNPYRKNRFEKNSFEFRVSALDDQNDKSLLNNSLFKGFYNLFLTFGVFYVISNPIQNELREGKLMKTTLFDSFKTDFLMAIFVWPLFYLWTFNAFFIQKLVLKGLPAWLVFLWQHSSQSLMFLFCIYIVIQRNWGVTHTVFVTFQAVVHFMKMHSYTMSNRDLREEWLAKKSSGKLSPGNNYPNNVTFKNFNNYLWAPTLSYETSYPKTPSRSWLYILRKTFYCLLSLLLLYIVTSDSIIPVLLNVDQIPLAESILRLIFPVTILFLVMFFLVFESMCNIFAEVTRFGDRQFYQDWWNATTFEEFNRKWSRPVHEFLFRHVYLEAIHRYKMGKNTAQFLTFAFSAGLHEMVLALLGRSVKPILFILIIIQIPLIFIGQKLKGTQIGNYFLWFTLIIGMPLIIILYAKENALFAFL